jgi:hypothetical protein
VKDHLLARILANIQVVLLGGLISGDGKQDGILPLARSQCSDTGNASDP